MNKLTKRLGASFRAGRSILKQESGASLIEMVMVMMLLVVFGFTIYSLIYAGSETQKKIMDEKDAQVSARIALSYINVRLRQNDDAGKVRVAKNEATGQNAILIQERGDDDYDTWIYWSDGKLLECLTDAGEPPVDANGFTIVEIAGFQTVLNPDGSITDTVQYEYNGQLAELSQVVDLRSGVSAGTE